MLGIIVVCCLFCCWKLFRHHSGVKDCVQDTVPHMDRDSTSRTSGGKKQTGTFPSIRASMLTYSIWKYMKTYEDMWRYVKIYEGVRVKSRTPWLFASQECYQSNWNVTHVQASCSAGYSYGRDKARSCCNTPENFDVEISKKCQVWRWISMNFPSEIPTSSAFTGPNFLKISSCRNSPAVLLLQLLVLFFHSLQVTACIQCIRAMESHLKSHLELHDMSQLLLHKSA